MQSPMVLVLKHSWLCDSWADFYCKIYTQFCFLFSFHCKTPVELCICASYYTSLFTQFLCKNKECYGYVTHFRTLFMGPQPVGELGFDFKGCKIHKIDTHVCLYTYICSTQIVCLTQFKFLAFISSFLKPHFFFFFFHFFKVQVYFNTLSTKSF